jgi:predicted transposase YdaD
MLGITLQQMRVYQDAKAEGELIGEARMILRLLNRRLGSIPDRVLTQIQQLTVPKLEDFGEALVEWEGWLSHNSQ